MNNHMLVRRSDCAKTRVLVSLLVLLAGASTAFGSEEIRVVETRNIVVNAAAENGASHELQLFLYSFRGTRWSQEHIVETALEGAELLEQCGVVLSRATLHVLEAPARFRYYHTPVSRELLRRIKVTKPAVFFVEDTRNNPSFDAEAIGRGNARTQPELTDTIWIAYEARDLPQTFAHEVVHVLSDEGEHSTEPANLMRASTSWRNTRLTAAQCARLRSRGEMNGLLTARSPSTPETWGVRNKETAKPSAR